MLHYSLGLLGSLAMVETVGMRGPFWRIPNGAQYVRIPQLVFARK
jgi:hypothetical protein